MLHRMELIRPQMNYMMNVLGKRTKFLLVVGFLWNSEGR
jgi:hypothetical protein